MTRSEAATIRRAEKRKRTVEEQRKYDLERELAANNSQEKASVKGVPTKVQDVVITKNVMPHSKAKEKAPVKEGGVAKSPRLSGSFSSRASVGSDLATLHSVANGGSLEERLALAIKEERYEDAASIRDAIKAQNNLQDALALAIKEERYEDAAKLRDAIKAKDHQSKIAKPKSQGPPSGNAAVKSAAEKSAADKSATWAPQSDEERIKENMELRRRYVTEREALTKEELARAEALIARDEKKKQKKLELAAKLAAKKNAKKQKK
jgi:hypothetical protein